MRQRRLASIVCSGIVAVLLLCAGPGRVLGAADYVSLYSFGQLAAWCAKTPCDGTLTCEQGAYPCTGAEYVYRTSTTINGFRNLYDFNRARLLCGVDYPDADQCGVDLASVSLALSTPGLVGRKNVVNDFPDHFRFFIPPGATYVTVNIYGPFGEKIGFVSRFRQQPDARYAGYGTNQYDLIDWRAGAAPTLKELAAADVYQSNPSAFVQVLNFSRTPQTAVGVDEAGWVYVKKLPFTTSLIYDVKVQINVDRDKFMDWYDSVRSVTAYGGCADSNAGGAGGYMCWDAGGDPWTFGSTAAVPEPEPEPASECTAQNLADCGTVTACEAVGGYWYDNACNAESLCGSPDDCPEESCAASRFYWYDDRCNELPKCRAGNESGCETALACDRIGGYWWDDACHDEPACAEASGCTREEYCTRTASGDDFHWWDGACHDEPDPDAACGRENLGACTDSLECQMNGGLMYDDGVCRARECSERDVGACETSAACVAVGGSWTGTYCTAAAATGSCSASRLSACTNPLSCQSAGGVWVNNGCQASSPGSSGSDDDDDDDDDGGGSGGGSVILPGSGTCSRATPERCINAVACASYAQGYWYDNGCHLTPEPAAAIPASECDANHLSLCAAAAECAAAGGCWAGTACVAPVTVVGQDAEDFNQHRSDAWVDLGNDAWDGELLAGEKILFDLLFPCAANGTGSYAAIELQGLEDAGLLFLQNHEQGNAFAADGLPEPLEREGVAAIDTSLLAEPLDVCAALGDDYRGRMTVYFLNVNEDTGRRFNSLEELLAAVNDADTSWYLGWYHVDIDCGRTAGVELAAPETAQAALTAAGMGSGQMEIIALTGTRILLQPQIAAAAGDAGQTVTPVMYIYLPDGDLGMLLPTGAPVVLGDVLDFAAIFAEAIELGGSGISRFQVFYGYVLADGTVKSNAYEVRLGD
ncbi:MAG: hypothetical protein JW781_08110 [Deltaproteobacteria bacterium]|nr:hypothetical protein [Candidatus Anaeroferrophillacea bacterium]